METKVITGNFPKLGESGLEMITNRIALRTMSADNFIEKHASGTLRKAKRIGFSWKNLYLAERTAYEFGYGFEIKPKTHIQYGAPVVEGDCHPVTEAGWHIERYLSTKIFTEDEIIPAYLTVSSPGEQKREGIGMVVTQTSAPFVPCGHVVYALIAEYDGAWKEAKNPA
jgi:hypothetical protein